MRQEQFSAFSQAVHVTNEQNALQSAANPMSLAVVHVPLLSTSSRVKVRFPLSKGSPAFCAHRHPAMTLILSSRYILRVLPCFELVSLMFMQDVCAGTARKLTNLAL